MGTSGLALAELVDPASKNFVATRFEIEELDAHADARFDDADDGESLHNLPFAGKSEAGARLERKRLAGTDKAAAQRDVAGNSVDLVSVFEVDELRIRRKGIANRIATIAYTSLWRGVFIEAAFHSDYVAHGADRFRRGADGPIREG